MPPFAFKPLREELYSFHELFDGYSAAQPGSFAKTTDFRIYRQYVSTGRYAPTDHVTAMMEAVHDNSIRADTQDYLKGEKTRGTVAFMGGHDLARGSSVYVQVAFMAQELARKDYLPISGGGPGAMEATHLGALHRNSSPEELKRALKELKVAAEIPNDLKDIVSANGKVDRDLVAKAHAWLLPAYRIRMRMESQHPGESLAVPTWLYGHEPTTVFATQIAKYFQNSIREDRLLSMATHGVIYVEGKAGTLQEIFQDASLNYYRVLGNFSPMVFLGKNQWERKLPVIRVLKKLFGPKVFKDYVCVTNKPEEALAFVLRRGTRETPAKRMLRFPRS
jgi:predicted Rossmann-fold nucleotide-binding protein